MQSGTATWYYKKNGQLATCAPDYIDCPYKDGGNGPSSFDCSGLQYYLYNFVGVTVGDKTAQRYYSASTKISEDDLRPGDWIFFDQQHAPPDPDDIDHTMMYKCTKDTGWKVVIHASKGAGKVEERTFDQWWEDHSDGLYGHMYGENERF